MKINPYHIIYIPIALLLMAVHIQADEHEAASKDRAPLVAMLTGTYGNDGVDGYVLFTPGKDGVKVKARVRGLKPGSYHGIHIHQFGDLSKGDGTSAGGHFNPRGTKHGLPTDEEKHAGDLGNIVADAKGFGTMDMTFKSFTTTGGDTAILGRAIVLHAEKDDGGQPTGNAGPRMAVGIIGYANPELIGDESGAAFGEVLDSVTNAAEAALEATKETVEDANE